MPDYEDYEDEYVDDYEEEDDDTNEQTANVPDTDGECKWTWLKGSSCFEAFSSSLFFRLANHPFTSLWSYSKVLGYGMDLATLWFLSASQSATIQRLCHKPLAYDITHRR